MQVGVTLCLQPLWTSSVIARAGASALARHLSAGTSKISFIDLVRHLFLSRCFPSDCSYRYGTISRIQVCLRLHTCWPRCLCSPHPTSSDVQALADALDSTPHFVQIYTDHNPKCHNANHILRFCKNHKAEAKRHAPCPSTSLARMPRGNTSHFVQARSYSYRST